MGMATQQKSKASPRGRATERRDRKATEKKADKKTRRKEWRAKKRKQVDSREEYNPKHGEEEDEEEPAKKKKKKKKGKKEQLGPDGEPLPQKLTVGGLKPKLWDSPGVVIRKGGKFEAGVGATLLPFRRDVRCAPGPDEPQLDEAATEELRKLLRLRVPEQRTRVCRFWQQGNCSRGDACGFAHANATDGPAAARCPPPVQSLADRTLPKLIGRAMLHLGFSRPTPVQSQAWPAALAGHDLLCRAPTGSGKTLAYLLPAMAHAEAQRPGRPGEGPGVLVLVPTRELAMQVSGTAESLRKVSGQRCVALYGGAPRDEQVEALERHVSLCVCTTGRLLDMLVSRHAELGRVTLLVLDEADLLISLGFEDQVQQIAGQLRPDRQTLLFSATFSDRLEAAAGQWLRSPLRVYAEGVRGEGGRAEGGRGEGGRGERAIEAAHTAAAGGAGGRARQRPRAMVFVNRIKEIKALQAALKRSGFSAAALHGEHSQRERELALSDFKAGKASVLLATDLGARGVDIRLLAAVVNYDVPLSLAAYVHRAGRTGRQGHAGVVISLLKRDESSRHFARGAARLLALGALPPDETLTALLAAELPAAGALGPQQRPVLPQAAGAAPAAAPAGAAAPAAAAYAGDLLAFAADFAAATPGGGAAAVKKKAPPKKKVKVPQVQ